MAPAQIELVARDQVELEWGVSAKTTAGAVPDHCLRHIQQPPAPAARPQAPVGLLGIVKEWLPEAADLLPCPPANQERAAEQCIALGHLLVLPTIRLVAAEHPRLPAIWVDRQPDRLDDLFGRVIVDLW